MLQDSIVRLRGTEVAGPYGGIEIDWSSPSQVILACEVFSPVSDEEVAMAQRVEAQYVVQVFPEADVTPVDRIVWEGDTYEVVSGVDKLAARGKTHQLKFLMRKVTGG